MEFEDGLRTRVFKEGGWCPCGDKGLQNCGLSNFADDPRLEPEPPAHGTGLAKQQKNFQSSNYYSLYPSGPMTNTQGPTPSEIQRHNLDFLTFFDFS